MKVITLDIGMIVARVIYSDPIAASKKVKLEYRPNLKDEWQLTTQQLMDYNDFISTILSIITARDFEIVEEYQSDESYSYYVQFTPVNQYTGEKYRLDVKFRLSDHGDTVTKPSSRNAEKLDVVFKSYYVNNIERHSLMTIIDDVRKICNELMVGDYSSFTKIEKSGLSDPDDIITL